MADVKWIKITTDIFDDEKILLIESMPDSNAIIVVWFKLLCLAGKQNNSGVFMLNDKIAYTDKMLSTIFRMNEATVQMALKIFEQFGMIEIVDGVITIPNWGKHQSLDQMEERKQYMKNYMQDYRQKQKKISCKVNGKVNSKVNVNTLEEDIEEDKEIELDKDNIIVDSSESTSVPKKVKPTKHKYGEYNNVLLTDEELCKLKTEYSDYEERIERLSSYIASTGKKYKSHYATIRNWARNETKAIPKQQSSYVDAINNRMSVVDDWLKGE